MVTPYSERDYGSIRRLLRSLDEELEPIAGDLMSLGGVPRAWSDLSFIHMAVRDFALPFTIANGVMQAVEHTSSVDAYVTWRP